MNNSFLTAAASYYGLDNDQVRKSEAFSDAGEGIIVFEIRVTNDDIVGIAKRMQELASSSNQIVTIHDQPELPSDDQLRSEYGAMTAKQKSAYGSFAQYKTARMAGMLVAFEPDELGMPKRQVTHVDAPDDSEPVNMGAVWLRADELSDAQRQFASDFLGMGHDGQYLVQWAMLTDEQKAKANEVNT
jgi:hypothetical protein